MGVIPQNIHPVFDRILQRKDKELLIQQNGLVIWMTGLSGSGKTTIAIALENRLNELGLLTQVLDGDNVRGGINNNLGFTLEDRSENIRRVSEVSKLFLNCGVITINCFISPTKAIRTQAKQIIGEKDFIEVFINTPLAICEKRDVKGLYKKARTGEIINFTGIDAPFENPTQPDIDVQTENLSVEGCVNQILKTILPLVKSI